MAKNRQLTVKWGPILPFPAVITANRLPYRPTYQSPTNNGYWSSFSTPCGQQYPVDVCQFTLSVPIFHFVDFQKIFDLIRKSCHTF